VHFDERISDRKVARLHDGKRRIKLRGAARNSTTAVEFAGAGDHEVAILTSPSSCRAASMAWSIAVQGPPLASIKALFELNRSIT
jgi:hypothetical protein